MLSFSQILYAAQVAGTHNDLHDVRCDACNWKGPTAHREKHNWAGAEYNPTTPQFTNSQSFIVDYTPGEGAWMHWDGYDYLYLHFSQVQQAHLKQLLRE